MMTNLLRALVLALLFMQCTSSTHKQVLEKQCGSCVRAVACNPRETGPQCQRRLGDQWEVIYYPAVDKYIAEWKADQR